MGGHIQGTHLEYLFQVTRASESMSSTGHLLHKATVPRLGDIITLPRNKCQEGAKMR